MEFCVGGLPNGHHISYTANNPPMAMEIGVLAAARLSPNVRLEYITPADMLYRFKEITIATNNPGKLAELRGLLDGCNVSLRTLADFPDTAEVDETGSTFLENARLKAAGYARQTGTVTIADDSGLVIDALGGRPGVLSARYGGDTGFPEKMALVLDELSRSGDNSRRARFVCSIAIADEGGEIVFEAEGVCEGRIADDPSGSGGFGYDPIFIPDGHDLSFGELPGAVKQQISHRARAFAEIIPFLRDNIAI